jgi:hypothetical protein
VADGDESLLDVFVNIKPDPGFMAAITASADAAINEYTRVFSSASIPSPRIGPPNVSGGGSGGGGGGSSGGGGNPANQAANDLRNQLRQAILEFQRDKAFLEVDVRIANDKDIQGRLQDITNRVKANEAIARAPESDETQQAEAIRRIIDLRLQNLDALRQTANVQRSIAGLDAAELDRNLRFRQEGVAAGQSLLGVKTVGKTVTAAKDTGLTQEFETLTTALNQAKFNLKQAFGAQSLVDVTAARTDIERIAAQLNDLRTRAQDKIVIDLQVKTTRATVKEDFDLEVKRGREEISTGRISNEYEASLTRGNLANADTRRAIALMKFEVKSAEEAVRRLSLAFDGTQISVKELSDATQYLASKNLELKLTYQEAQKVSNSMNTLSNNAYQLGQAFEDFAVGFSLNGVAGGLRGASNNIAFILNDLSRAPAIAATIGAKFAGWLPLIAGVGSALAITVLPKLVEWLESLNDIESKFEDISAVLREDFARVEFDVGLGLDRENFLRSINDAKELKDIVKQLADQVQNAQDKGSTLKGIFEGIDETGNLSKVLSQIREFNSLLEYRKRTLEIRIDNASASGSSSSVFKGFGAFGLGASTSDFLANVAKDELEILQPVIQKTSDVYDGLRKARENGINGSADQVQLRQTVDGFNELLKVVEKTSESFDLSDSEAGKNLVAVLSEMKSEIASIEKIAAEMDSFSKSVADGLAAAEGKVKDLSSAQEIIRRQINGTASDQALYVFEVLKTSQAYAALIENVREFDSLRAKQLGLGTEEIDKRATSLKEALSFQTENELLLKRKDILEEIDRIRGKDAKRGGSSNTNFEAYVQSLQKNVLSDPLDKNTLALERLTNQLNDMESGINAVRSERPVANDIDAAVRTLPIGGGVGAGAIEFMLRAGSQVKTTQQGNDIAEAVNKGVREAMQGFVAPVVGEQKQTTDAVRKLNVGARAQ